MSSIPDAPARNSQWQASHEAILSAARTVFGRAGYRASTPEIAGVAGVTERTLFRHFPTKPDLFREAVVEPFHTYIRDYVHRWAEEGPGVREPERAVRDFYEQLWAVLDEHRDLMFVLAAARRFDDPDGTRFPDLATELGARLDELRDVMRRESEARGWTLDPAILVRMMFGLVTTMSAQGDWMFGPGGEPPREQLLEQLTLFTVHGLSGR